MTTNNRIPVSAPRPLSPARLCARLEKTYGPLEPPEQWPVLNELVAVMLSQKLVRHGRTVCTAVRPACDRCVPVDRCTEGPARLNDLRRSAKSGRPRRP